MVRPGLVFFSAALLVLPTIQGVATADGSADASLEATIDPEPRGSILIEGDDALAHHPAVRSGDGTASNPYRISNWTIATVEPYAIRLDGTSAHVVIEDIWIPDVGAGRDVNPFWGIHVTDSSNVTVQRVLINEATGLGVEFEQSTDSVLRDSRLANTGTDRVRTIGNGVLVDDSSGILVENLTVRTARNSGTVYASSDIEIRQSTFWPDPGTAVEYASYLDIYRSSDVTVLRSEFFRTYLDIFESAGDVTVARNAFLPQAPSKNAEDYLGGPGGQGGILGEHAGRIDICGNRFDGSGGYGISLSRAGTGRIVGNAFTDWGLDFEVMTGGEVHVEHNAFQGNTGGTLELGTTSLTEGRAEVHGNVFENNDEPVIVSSEMNATDNWWGALDGPNVTGGEPNGSGQAIEVEDGGEVTVDPWLEQPPKAGPASVACTVPPGPVGAQQGPGTEMQIQAAAGASLALGDHAGPFPVDGEVQTREAIQLGPYPLSGLDTGSIWPAKVSSSTGLSNPLSGPELPMQEIGQRALDAHLGTGEPLHLPGSIQAAVSDSLSRYGGAG